jgi:hypothetical protein
MATAIATVHGEGSQPAISSTIDLRATVWPHSSPMAAVVNIAAMMAARTGFDR